MWIKGTKNTKRNPLLNKQKTKFSKSKIYQNINVQEKILNVYLLTNYRPSTIFSLNTVEKNISANRRMSNRNKKIFLTKINMATNTENFGQWYEKADLRSTYEH